MSNVGIGIPKYWQLRNDHPFFNAAVHHDASYHVADIFLQFNDIEEARLASRVLVEEDPIYYMSLCVMRFDSLALWWEEDKEYETKKQVVRRFIDNSDRIFLQMCKKEIASYYDNKLAERVKRDFISRVSLTIQATLFFQIVKVYSSIKYRV